MKGGNLSELLMLFGLREVELSRVKSRMLADQYLNGIPGDGIIDPQDYVTHGFTAACQQSLWVGDECAIRKVEQHMIILKADPANAGADRSPLVGAEIVAQSPRARPYHLRRIRCHLKDQVA